jgi:hypothetical protein
MIHLLAAFVQLYLAGRAWYNQKTFAEFARWRRDTRMKDMQLDSLTLRYWQDFELADADLEYLSEMLIEEEAPLTVEELTRRLMRRRVQDEKAAWEDREAKGRVYQPRETYEVGDLLVFPALADASGTVVGVRAGRNPDYAPFEVIQVRMEGGTKVKEFASSLSEPHALNIIQAQQEEEINLDDLDAVGAALFERYGNYVTPVVLAGLSESGEFVRFGEEWFLRGFLLPIKEGHLNLAEAVLDLAAGFSAAQEILNVLDMPAETSHAVQMFSLNHALASDKQERFRFAGTNGMMIWCLPRVADTRPLRFRKTALDVSRDHLLDDIVELPLAGTLDREARVDAAQWSHTLTFYDWYWGHLPYDRGARDLLVEPLLEDQDCVQLRLRFVRGEETFPLVVHYPSERRLGWWGGAELRNFFEEQELAPGAMVRLRRTPTSETEGIYEIDFSEASPSRMEMLDYEEGGQPVFRRMSVRCAVDEERTLSRSRFSALEALYLLDEGERRLTSLLLKTTFQRVAEKLLRGLGIVYRASFTDLLVASNIERPFPATILVAIFEQEAYPCFYRDDEGYYVYDPGRSDILSNRVRLTREEAILDPAGSSR